MSDLILFSVVESCHYSSVCFNVRYCDGVLYLYVLSECCTSLDVSGVSLGVVVNYLGVEGLDTFDYIFSPLDDVRCIDICGVTGALSNVCRVSDFLSEYESVYKYMDVYRFIDGMNGLGVRRYGDVWYERVGYYAGKGLALPLVYATHVLKEVGVIDSCEVIGSDLGYKTSFMEFIDLLKQSLSEN